MLKRLMALAAAVALLSGAAKADDLVRLGNLKFAHYGAVSYMKEIAPKYGVKIEENVFAKGADIYPAMASGSIDVAASASDGAIAARGNGAPIYAVAGFASGGARIVTRKGVEIGSIKALKGRKTGVARGAAQEILLLAELEKHGLTWSDKPGKDVQIIYLGFAELNQALATGGVDAICQSEPQASIAIARGIGVELMKPYDTPVGVPVRLLVMTETLYRDKPELAAKVMRIFLEATRAFRSDKALAERYVRAQMFKGSLSGEEYAAAMENAEFTTDVDPAQLDVTTGLMTRYGLGKMANPPRSADWVKLDLLERAKTQAQNN